LQLQLPLGVPEQIAETFRLRRPAGELLTQRPERQEYISAIFPFECTSHHSFLSSSGLVQSSISLPLLLHSSSPIRSTAIALIAAMATTTLDPNYGYVLLAATSTFLMNHVHVTNSGRYRKAAKVQYPAAYAPESRTDEAAHKFNCAQRAHANFIENQPSMLAALLLAGLQFPVTAAVMGAGWTVSRYVYMDGYCRGGEGGKGRYRGSSFWLFQLGLVCLTGYTGVAMVMGW